MQFPASTQGFNRYAYVGNNPLSYTDPSGYFLKKALKIGLTIAASYYTSGWAAGFFNSAAAGAAVGGAVGGYLNTGSMQGAALGALSGGVAFGVGGAFGHQLGYSEFGQLAAKSLTHGVTQGLIAKAGGGRFGDGALGVFAASIGGPSVAGAGPGVRQAMAAATLGGTVSVIGGGKFANGAISGAFVNIFNDQADMESRDSYFARARINRVLNVAYDTLEGFDFEFKPHESFRVLKAGEDYVVEQGRHRFTVNGSKVSGGGWTLFSGKVHSMNLTVQALDSGNFRISGSYTYASVLTIGFRREAAMSNVIASGSGLLPAAARALRGRQERLNQHERCSLGEC